MSKLSSAVAFFYKHAGWSYKPGSETKRQGRMRGARLLATAERRAQEKGLTVKWEDDPDGFEDRPEAREVLCARIPDPVDPRHSLASLCGIDDPTRTYARVVEAELALEALGPEPTRPRGASRARRRR